MLLTKTET